MEIDGLTYDVPALVEKMQGPDGIRLRDRKFLGKTFEKSFTGKEAVEWLVSNVPKIKPDQAVQLGKRLLSQRIIKHASSRCKGFSNSHNLFQFTNATATGGDDKKAENLVCGAVPGNPADLMQDELFEVYQVTVHEGMFKEKPGLRSFIIHRPTATGPEITDWLSKKFNITKQRAFEVATQLFNNKYMTAVCGSPVFSENWGVWFTAGNLEYLNAIDKAEETQSSTLALTGGNILFVPSRLADLPHLKTLDMSNNEIGLVCQNISFLPNLEDLLLANNKITRIGADMSHLRSLKKLDLSNNQIASVPVSISQLLNLETLLLDNNKLTVLPNEFSALTNMKTLSLASNQFKDVPDCIAKYEKLEVLNLKSNPITTIPVLVVGLVSLREIHLQSTPLEQLPAFLGGLPNIQYIGLDATNNIHCPPKSLIEMGSEVIINYLKALQDSVMACFCGKMLILGMENVGKTSLLQAIQAEKKFLRSPKPKARNLSTDGISISCVTLDKHLKEAPAEGPYITEKGLFRKKIVERLILGIWDFAGQDTYYTTHEFFLTENAIYTVVWDIRKPPEESRVDFWLKSIQSRAPHAPVILVATHVDMVEKNKLDEILVAVDKKYTKKYPQIALIECVSTTTMDGIKEFKRDMRKLAMEQPFIRNRIPGRHYGLAQAIVNERTTRNPPIATWEQYKEIAKLVNITDPKSVDMATRHLHELGFLLHFREESLKDLVILSPQWLSDCFSTIVTVKNTFCKNGRLPLKSLPHIWKSETFPASMQSKLLRILEIFEVIFIMRKPNVPESEIDAIVPSLLPSEQPQGLQSLWDTCLDDKARKKVDGADGSDKVECHTVGRKFDFSFITRAFFSRLLVRLLHVGTPLEYWRHGIISRKHGAYGLVKFDETNCILTVSVKSPQAKEGADLFQVILENVNTLISDWPKVNARISAPCVCSDACHKHPHYFTLHEIENQLLVQAGYIICPKTGINVCLDSLAPDLSLSNLKENKIDPAEITGLEPIGSGSFAEVFKAAFRGEVVAVKQLILSESDSPSLRLSDLTSGSLSSSSSFNTLDSDASLNSMDNSLNGDNSVHGNNDSKNGNSLSSQGHSVSLSSLKGSLQSTVSQSMLEYLHEFRREVVLMSTLRHENIVCMKGFCHEPYSIVMEFMDQGSLASYVRDNKDTLTYKTRLHLALDVARGMRFLHHTSPPIVHRDLKSPNVLLKAIPEAPFVQAKISDFGLSRTMVTGFVSKVVDNPRWCAPEIIKKTEYDEKSDVYSFGITLWEILTGDHPFAEFDIKWTHVLEDKIVEEGLRPTVPGSCPSEYASLTKRCWAASPASRPSFSEIVPELEVMLSAL